MDCWLFHVNTDYSAKSLVATVVPWDVEHLSLDNNGAHESSERRVSSAGPSAGSNVVFVGEKKRGGLRIVDARLTCDVVLAPVPPPHIHTDQGPSFTSSAMPRMQSCNVATAMVLCAQTTSDLWVGWSSGHISVLSIAAAPVVMAASSSPSAHDVPRYGDWDDVLYAHRGAVHHMVATHADRYVVSCSYDMNVVVWEASSRRQLRSLTALARNAQLTTHVPASHTPNTGPVRRQNGVGTLHGAPPGNKVGGAPLSGGICRFVCEYTLLVMRETGALHDAARATVLWVAFDSGAQVVVHGMEALQRRDVDASVVQDDDVLTEGLTVASVDAVGGARWTPTAAAAASLGDVASVVCCGDDRGHVRFVSCAAVLCKPKQHTAAATSPPSLAATASATMEAAFSDDASTALSLGHKCGKVVEIVSCGVVACPPTSHNGIDSNAAHAGDGGAPAPSSTTQATFAFVATCSNRTVALVRCTVLSVACGSLITHCNVVSVQTAAAPIVSLRMCAASLRGVGVARRQEAVAAQPLQLHYALGSDGSVSTVLTFAYGAAPPSPMSGTAGQTATAQSSVASWGYGDMARERSRLKHAVELVQRAKNSVLTADTMVLDRLQQQAALTEAHRELEQQVDGLRQALARETARADSAEERLCTSEEAGEALRARLRDATSERERLSSLLDIAATDQQRTTAARDAAQETAAFNAIKVDECILQLEQRQEECNHLERGWKAAESASVHLKERNEILAAKVVELERLLAAAEDAVRTRAEKTHNHVALLDEQQEVIRELKTRHQQALRHGEHCRLEAEQLRMDVLALQRQLAHKTTVQHNGASGWPSSLQTHHTENNLDDEVSLKAPSRHRGEHHGASLPPHRRTISSYPSIAAGEDAYRRSTSSTQQPLPTMTERLAGISHTIAARDDSPQHPGDYDGGVQRGPYRSSMSSQAQASSSSIHVLSLGQPGSSTAASSADPREEYLKSLAPPVRTDAPSRSAAPASNDSAPTDLGALVQPGSVAYNASPPAAGHSELRDGGTTPPRTSVVDEAPPAYAYGTTPGSSTSTSVAVPRVGEAPRSTSGGGVRSVTVSLKPAH